MPAHYFWRHVAWRSRGVLRVLFSPITSDAEVCDAEVALVVDHEVLWLDISMNDLLLMAILKAGNKACHKET